MRSILIQPKAKSDLKSIGRYTLAEFGLDQAKRYTSTISRAIERIATGEGRASPVTEIGEDYSKISVGSHIVYFRITEKEVVIVRILNSRMNAPDHL